MHSQVKNLYNESGTCIFWDPQNSSLNMKISEIGYTTSICMEVTTIVKIKVGMGQRI
jgi:hypothetical protein